MLGRSAHVQKRPQLPNCSTIVLDAISSAKSRASILPRSSLEANLEYIMWEGHSLLVESTAVSAVMLKPSAVVESDRDRNRLSTQR